VNNIPPSEMNDSDIVRAAKMRAASEILRAPMPTGETLQHGLRRLAIEYLYYQLGGRSNFTSQPRS